ncbi:MAG: hypothetical protein PHO32_08965, partial [Candidatus Cloacimonetes bacterium]|nr:hypothetical protein [Candidatus Cloacimonadota bacterium]
RLNMDTADYIKNKLPKGDYDFEIIFNAYPERINGKIPADVINHVAGVLVQLIGKKHEDYLPFFRNLWTKKGDYGKIAFTQIMTKLLHKKPAVYIPVFDEALANADHTEINSLLDKVMLPILRKYPEKFLDKAYQYCASSNEALQKDAINLMVKLLKRREDLIPTIMQHFTHEWHYPITNTLHSHILLLRAVAKQSPEYYLELWKEYGSSRDPQIVELMCASITEFIPELEASVELWTRSGNARLKKAATTALRVLQKKKGA